MKTWIDKENRLWKLIDCEDIEERKRIEREYFDEVCSRVILNPRFYLDHLDELDVFRVSWIKYKREKTIPL